jgi:hypothetical protein
LCSARAFPVGDKFHSALLVSAVDIFSALFFQPIDYFGAEVPERVIFTHRDNGYSGVEYTQKFHGGRRRGQFAQFVPVAGKPDE